jgi:hypothetical protein
MDDKPRKPGDEENEDELLPDVVDDDLELEEDQDSEPGDRRRDPLRRP